MENRTLLFCIARSLAHEGYRHLSPFLLAGREGRDAALDTIVLREANLDELMLNPSLINLNGTCRHFFTACLRARNECALYLEGLRLAIQGGPAEEAICMLLSASFDLKLAVYASALLYYCLGNPQAAKETLSPLRRSHPTNPFYTCGEIAEALEICNFLFSQISSMGPSRSGRFNSTWTSGGIPQCITRCAGRVFCDCVLHCSEEVPCSSCMMYWMSLKFCQLC